MYQQRPGRLWRLRWWLRRSLPALGPAFVAAIAYVDPGNVATNVAAGGRFGYLLVWVVVVANVMAMLIQYLSAKAGLATGLSLPALCREHLPRRVVGGLWLQAELVAIATDVAEVVGGALALRLLFGLPLLTGGLITAGVAFALLLLKNRGHRPFEIAVTGMLGVILVGFAYDLVLGRPDVGALVGGSVPRFDGAASVVLASAMLGATVMPHAIYLHSGLTAERAVGASEPRRRFLLRGQRVDVVVAMTLAGLVNLAMLVVAASMLRGHGDTIEAAHAALGEVAGRPAAVLFAVALLASGFAASSVGTLSGQLVMEGFLRRRLPLVLRRLVSLAPALVVLAVGVDPTKALVASQGVLSLGIPFALVPLVLFTRRRDLMGALVNRRLTTVVGGACAALVIALNLALVGSLV
ncbi:divalent metal cation transporter MntH [Nocardioides mangrovicus]|uniref:Divalent metal cation transporter MntH n=1 Tax=Nocardioides mangrovicus TaxID=2478913 RepID=A0A3L8P2P2_9ACTN|nr:Nramp family divalent metal transporter [Nocardioides mangrovicus]RLV49565.1 divalent metal cation transporter MntH [Nocardioides mangrovicus]